MPRNRLGFAVPASLLLLGIALLCLALALHGAGMDDQVMHMLGACLAVMVASVVPVLRSSPTRGQVALAVAELAVLAFVGRWAPRGRYPPDEGTVLIH